MSGVSKAVSKDTLVKVKVALAESQKSGDISWKLQAIVSTTEFSIKHVAEVINVSRLTLMNWIKVFVSEGADGLKLKPGRGRKSILSSDEGLQVKSWLMEEPNMTIEAVRLKIERVFKKKIGKSATNNLIHRLDFSYITPRPVHYKQDKDQQAVFKKKPKP